MKNEQYIKLRDQVSEMNKINDEISLINWNREDGPKFSSVEDMKDFEKKLKNNEFDYFFDKENNNSILDTRDVIIESFSHTLEDISFYIYTFKNQSNSNYVTYMALSNIQDNGNIDKLCGNSTSNKELAHNYFENLKLAITTNSIEDILDNLIVGAEKTLLSLKNKLSKLTSEN
ncbi:hypothetical protein [Thomasclavelia cocleata]|uniref:hypothetical protein n=1 Tax=Thomasclavelia cocleata TaxID=69824 RepID=UPI00261D5CFA|nr:hypothetical protein [Thomasclavelia cocleata]